MNYNLWIHKLIHETIHFTQLLGKGFELGRMISDATAKQSIIIYHTLSGFSHSYWSRASHQLTRVNSVSNPQAPPLALCIMSVDNSRIRSS